jgi:hypothetical protein
MRHLPTYPSRIFGFVLLTVCMGLAACGVSAATPAAKAPAATSVAAASTTGCPVGAQTALPWGAPTQMVAAPHNDQIVNVTAGQSIEITLPFGRHYTLAPLNSPNLSMDAPLGYSDATTKMCVWHFTAKSVGTVPLTFQSSVICAAGEMCPGAIAELNVIVTVK